MDFSFLRTGAEGQEVLGSKVFWGEEGVKMEEMGFRESENLLNPSETC